ncbi:MAG: HYR domain-containing protein [Bacteroidetes bacterium]|nr:HYR domain-containing protein [Bacteroidota bacterium]WKZ75790.1 MAG: HYR domain-containing protein [Vicingaceae bacterium]
MKKLLSITAGVLSAFTVSAQCPQITCPSNITVNNAPGTCGAVVNYVTPIGTNPCGGIDTFYYSGSVVTWTVPNGVTALNIEAIGAQGGDNIVLNGLGGKGARMIGDFTVAPGQVIKIIVGQQGKKATGGNTANGAGGGGGGSFVWIDGQPQPLIAAGGGGASCLTNNGIPHYYGKDAVTTNDGTGSRSHDQYGDSPGGTAGGNGTSVSASGGKGWYAVLSNPAGVLAQNYGGDGGFGGGGGCGINPNICNYLHTGGGGGGYSGGGAGGSCYYFGGGGGGSYNVGTNQSNTAGYQTGNGLVVLKYGGPAITTQTAGLPDGATFPVGVTTNWYKVEDGLGNADSCSFTVTVVDNEAPSITCPGDTTICWGVYNANITSSDNCPGATVTQTNGPTLGSSFDVGTYNLIFVVTDASGNKDTCDYNVTVEVCGGVNENNQKYGISVYPNPMREYVIIENKHIEGKYTIEITNTLGGIVKTINTTEKRVEIQKGDMSKGMYYYSIKQNNQTLSSGKLTVE